MNKNNRKLCLTTKVEFFQLLLLFIDTPGESVKVRSTLSSANCRLHRGFNLC